MSVESMAARLLAVLVKPQTSGADQRAEAPELVGTAPVFSLLLLHLAQVFKVPLHSNLKHRLHMSFLYRLRFHEHGEAPICGVQDAISQSCAVTLRGC